MRRGEYEEIEKETQKIYVGVEVRETEEGAEVEKGKTNKQTNKNGRNNYRKRARNRGLEGEGMGGRRIEGIHTANRKCWSAGTHVISSLHFIHINTTRARARAHTHMPTQFIVGARAHTHKQVHTYTHTHERTHIHI